MADVFISYAREDRPHAERLARALEAAGFTVWWDVENLSSGLSFNRSIQQALETAQRVVVLWSRASIQSDYVDAEAYWAWENKKLHSVRLGEDVEVPVPFNTSHARSLAAWDGSPDFPEFRRLTADLGAVEALAKVQKQRAQGVLPYPRKRRRNMPRAFTSFLDRFLRGSREHPSAPSPDEQPPPRREPTDLALIYGVSSIADLPKFIFAKSIEDLRQSTEVQPLEDLENELIIAHVPNGRFGRAQTYKLNSYDGLRIIGPSLFGHEYRVITPGVPLYQNLYKGSVEIHKDRAGIVYAVVFVSIDHKALIQQPNRNESIRIAVAFQPCLDFIHLVAIPRDRISSWRTRSLQDGTEIADCSII